MVRFLIGLPIVVLLIGALVVAEWFVNRLAEVLP
jgi:hypothetical protein